MSTPVKRKLDKLIHEYYAINRVNPAAIEIPVKDFKQLVDEMRSIQMTGKNGPHPDIHRVFYKAIEIIPV